MEKKVSSQYFEVKLETIKVTHMATAQTLT